MAGPYVGPNLGPLQSVGDGGGAAAVGAGPDPYARMFGDKPPVDAPGPAVAPDKTNYDHMFSDKPPVEEAPTGPVREFGKAESTIKGLGNSLMFGASPAIAGLAEASGMPSAASETGADMNPARPIIGAYKLIHNYLSEHPDPEVTAAYERGRKAQYQDEKLANEQHPTAYIMGQLGGALATPLGAVGAAAKTAGTAGRIGAGISAGGIGGGLYGAGGAVGEGKNDPLEIAKEAGKGAAVGAAFGGVAAGGGALIGKGYDKAASIYRGTRDVDAEAGRRVVGAIQSDVERQGPSMTREEIAAANNAGVPRAIIDTGGERTRSLARSSANTSPEGRQALTEMTTDRFHEQGSRIGGFIRQITGGGNSAVDREVLEAAARKANKPAYDRLMAQHPVVTVPSDVSNRPAVAQAMKDAVSLAKNHGEKIHGETELKTILSGDGYHIADDVANPAKTSLRYWDYVKKAIDARIEGLKGSGGGIQALNGKEVADFGGLVAARKALVDHLDAIAPNYKATRQGAAAFFGAENALEAGEKFVMSGSNIHEARIALRRMSVPERELFARGFASDLADKIERAGDNRNVLNSVFLNNGPARQKIEMALGVSRAREFEAMLRVEGLIHRAHQAVTGNSTTVRQAAESGLAGGGAVAAFEGLKEHDFNPMHVLAAALGAGAIRHGAQKIDSGVARRVGEMLASNDPAILRKGIQVVTASPVLFEQLRKATAAGARIAAEDIGPGNTAAGAATLGMRMINGPERAEGTHPADAMSDQVQ